MSLLVTELTSSGVLIEFVDHRSSLGFHFVSNVDHKDSDFVENDCESFKLFVFV